MYYKWANQENQSQLTHSCHLLLGYRYQQGKGLVFDFQQDSVNLLGKYLEHSYQVNHNRNQSCKLCKMISRRKDCRWLVDIECLRQHLQDCSNLV